MQHERMRRASVFAHQPVQERRSEGDDDAGESEEADHDEGDQDEPGELFRIGLGFHRRGLYGGGGLLSMGGERGGGVLSF